MSWGHHWIRDAWIGAGYFALASFAIIATRFDGGLAFLWLASAYLTAILVVRPRRRWAQPVLWSAIGGMIATGLFGFGWDMAPVLAAGNSAEALVAAYLLRRARSSRHPFGSLKWTVNLFWAAGIAGPAAMALIVMLPLWFESGQQPAVTFLRAVAGHGLSNLTFIPIIKLFVTGGSGRWQDKTARPVWWKVALLFAVQIAVTGAVFAQNAVTLLFLPILPLVAIVFRGGSRRSALSLILLAVIGGGFTFAGFGPIPLITAARGLDMQFLQLYLLSTVLTIVPVAAQLRSRSWLVRRVKDSEARYRMLADHSSDIISHTDLHGLALFVSPSISRLVGYEPDALIGRNILELIDPRDHALVHEQYAAAIVSGGEAVRFEYRGQTRDGQCRWFESVCRGVAGPDGRVESLVSIVRDISDRKQREDQLAAAAMTDSLTGVSNRRALNETAAAFIADQRANTASIALLDIDHFKSVNDRFGHETGDTVLQHFARVAQDELRAGDLLARVGGEEFAIFFPGLRLDAAVNACERIRAAVARAVYWSGAEPVKVTVSGGVAELGEDGFEAAIKRADKAMYRAKARGRDRMSLAA